MSGVGGSGGRCTYRRQALVVADVDVSVVLQQPAHALLLSAAGAREGERYEPTADSPLITDQLQYRFLRSV